MKPQACVVVASEMTVRAFLTRQLIAMQQRFDLTVVVNTTNTALLAELGIDGTLIPLPLARRAALWTDVRTLWQLVRVMRHGAFDLVHSMTPKAGMLAMNAARLARVPVRIHTFTGQVWATRRGLVRAALKFCDRVVAGAATTTLADSGSQRAFLITEGVVAADKIAVLERGSVSGVDGERFRPQPKRRQELRHQLGIPEDKIVLLFLGRLNRDKGVLDLARAFSAVADEEPNVHLIVVGPDEQAMRPRLSAACGRHVSKLTALDFTPAPEDVMAAADVLCLPSYREGFGTVIIEAAAVGVPAVASRINGIVDAVDDGTTGLLHEPGNVEALATELTRIVRDPGLRRALGEAARNRATRDFCQNRVTDAMLGFYARLLDEPRRITRRSWYRRGGKRAFDVVAATFAGLLLLPLAFALAVVIRMRLGSPVLFRQQRPGRGGRPFVLLKFRTMTDRRDDDGGLLSDAQRLTPLGRFLRAFSLDEIPQLWNVLSGEMSFVGPRPLLMHYLERYTPHQARRHEVRPGITGLAQVGGRNALGWEQKFDLDVTYVERCSLPLDMKILVRTCWQVLTCHGISQPGRATADEFMGTLRK